MSTVTITCPHCSYAREIPPERLPQSDVRVTCPRCKEGFPLSRGVAVLPPDLPPRPVAVAAATPAPQAATDSGAKPVPATETWHMSSRYRHLIVVLLVLFMLPFLLSSLLALTAKVPQTVYLQGAMQILFAAVAIAFLSWRIKTPLFELSLRGIRVNNSPFPSGQVEAGWQDLIGMVVVEKRLFGVKNIQLRLLLGRKSSPLRELCINPTVAERPDELLERLRERIPLLTAELLGESGRLGKNDRAGEVRYGSHILSSAGIAASRQLIPWGAVSSVSTPQFVLAGYGSVTIAYSTGGKPARLTVAAKMVPAYQAFVRTLLLNVPKAAIDPGVAKMLDCPPGEARRESLAILLLLLGLVLTLVATFLTINYEPVVSLKAACSMAAAAAGIIPFAVAAQLLVARLLGRVVPATRLLAWAGAACAGPLVAICLIFLVFPSARYALGGDIAYQRGNLDRAARAYEQSLSHYPDNLDARFALALVYREKREYARAFDCLQRVYQADPQNWDLFSIELIPDSLLKTGRYDEATDWCDRIMRDHPHWTDAVMAMQGKKREIASSRMKKTES